MTQLLHELTFLGFAPRYCHLRIFFKIFALALFNIDLAPCQATIGVLILQEAAGLQLSVISSKLIYVRLVRKPSSSVLIEIKSKGGDSVAIENFE